MGQRRRHTGASGGVVEILVADAVEMWACTEYKGVSLGRLELAAAGSSLAPLEKLKGGCVS